jgi:hypothetical protein
MMRSTLGLVAPSFFVFAVMSACSSPGGQTVAGDAGPARESGLPSPSVSRDGSTTPDAPAPQPGCDAGEPPNIYATSQPFECNESLQTIAATRDPSVTLSFDLVVPTGGSPTKVVILLPGGNGILGLSSTGIGQAADNFCVRTRQLFASAGLVVVVPEPASDRLVPASDPPGLDNFRDTPQHASDLSDLVAYANKTYAGLPVWMVSTSRGTISATNALANAKNKPDHIVLTSTVTVTPSGAADQENVSDVPNYEGALAAAAGGLLMISDSLDACGASPPEDAQELAQEVGCEHFVLIAGGPTPPSAGTDPDGVCGGLAYHGFYGSDDLVVNMHIVPFMMAH